MRDIPGFEGLYAVTEDGKVWSHKRQKFLKMFNNGQGYFKVQLSKNKNSKKYSVSRLVAITYIPNPENKPEVDHINQQRWDNRRENLRWVTSAENKANNSQKGKPKKFTPIICVETGEIFDSQKAAAEAKGIHKQGIVNVLAGQQKTAGGFHWARLIL